MKGFKQTILAVAAAGFVGFVARGAEMAADTLPRLTLEECIGIALTESPTVRVADMEVRRLDYSRRETIGALLPTVDFGGTYSRMLEKQVMYMNMDFGSLGGGNTGGEEGAEPAAGRASGRDEGIKMGLDNSFSLGFSASLPLIAPQLWKSIGLSDVQIARSVEAARQSRQDLVNRVKNAYYALLLAEDSRKVIRESYDMAALTHDTYVRQHAAGAASDYDVLRTSVAMRNIEPELMQADVAIRQATLQLQILMGIDSEFKFLPATTLGSYESDMYATALRLDRDYSRNAQLRLLDMDADMLRRNVTIEKLAFSPTLALTANYNWTSMSDGSPFKNFRWNPYSTIGLTLSVPILRGGQRINRIRQATIQAEELTWQRLDLERSIAMQVELAIDNIGVNVRQIESCAESVRQAETAHNIMERSREVGAASYLDIRDSELALTRSRLAYLQAIYNYLVANSDLELLLGNAPIESYIQNLPTTNTDER